MKQTLKTVVFFGSGPVAAACLERLAKHAHIEAVVTKPKPAHHKEPFPVIETAEMLNLPVYTAATKQELTSCIKQANFSSPLGVLIDFGIIVEQAVIDAFPRGIMNSHFSLLPEWRGADPITFSVLAGQATTGVSLMMLVPAMDEGPLVAFGEYKLPKDITTPQLTDHLIVLSDQMLQAELPKYLDNPDFKPAPQTITGRAVSYSRKLRKEDGRIDWQKPAEALEREVRAFLGWPKSYTTLGDQDVVITKAHVNTSKAASPGTIKVTDKQLHVATSDGWLVIDHVKPSGKKEMTAEAFINGYRQSLVTD